MTTENPEPTIEEQLAEAQASAEANAAQLAVVTAERDEAQLRLANQVADLGVARQQVEEQAVLLSAVDGGGHVRHRNKIVARISQVRDPNAEPDAPEVWELRANLAWLRDAQLRLIVEENGATVYDTGQ